MAKHVKVEFKYFDRNTCSRCKSTDKNVEKTLKRLQNKLTKAGVKFRLKTTKLPARRLSESNSVIINGKDIETIMNRKKGSRFTSCKGCSTLINGPCDCRAYTYKERKYSFVPGVMIREAVRKVLGKRD